MVESIKRLSYQEYKVIEFLRQNETMNAEQGAEIGVAYLGKVISLLRKNGYTIYTKLFLNQTGSTYQKGRHAEYSLKPFKR